MTEALESTNPMVEIIQCVQRDIQTLRNTAHILTPMARTKIDSVAVGKIPVLRVATISSNPDDHEVYEIKQLPGKFALTKVALMRLEAMAGITNWATSIEHGRLPDGSEDPLFVKATASAQIEDIDGTIRNQLQNFELNLNDKSPQSEKMVKLKDGKRDQKELTQARQYIVQLAESKAMNRVRRVLLNLQSTFTRDELKKPFVVMRLVDAPLDASDPLIKKLLVMKQLKISSEMYDSAAHDMHVQSSVAKELPPAKEPPKSLSGNAEPPKSLNNADNCAKSLNNEGDCAKSLRPDSERKPVIDITATTTEVTQEVTREVPKNQSPLVAEVDALYKKKVRGGRAANKVPLDRLTDDELGKIKEMLTKLADVKE